MSIRRPAMRICVAIVLLSALLVPNNASSLDAAGPRSTSSKSFVERGKEIRQAAVRQALGCEGSGSTSAECRAFRPADADDPASFDQDTVVVRYRAGRSATTEARAAGSRVVDRIADTPTVLLDVPADEDPLSFIETLDADPDVDFAEPNYRLESFSAPQVTDWGVRALDAEDATTNNGVTGAGVVVAVIDTGVDYTHEDLAGNIFINPLEDDGDGVFEPHGGADNNGVDDDGNGFVDDVAGYDFSGRFFTSTEPDNDPMDVAEHGTHVAGIIAAEDNAVGVRGVAPDAQILPVRVLDDQGAGFDSTIAEGIYYAADMGADVINMSLGGYGRSSAMREAVQYAHDAGTVVVAAAGNNWFYSLPSFPAAHEHVISVAAAADDDPTDDDETLSKVWFSDWGHADFLAPGVGVLSSTPDNRYQRFTGTSMASPHVAGAAALVIQELVDDANTPTPDNVEHLLASTANEAHFPDTDEVSGAGVPDAAAATDPPSGNRQELSREGYLIPADGATASTLTARVINDAGVPQPGEAVTFSTDKGTVTPPAGVTDLNGEATTELTVDDDFGVATVTASSGVGTSTARVIVEDDRVRVDDAYITSASTFEDSYGSYDDPFPPDDPDFEEPDDSLDVIIPMPGQEVVFRAYFNQHDFGFNDDRISALTWTVTDPISAPVPELSGELDPVTIPPAAATFFSPNFESEPMTIPEDAEPGTYTLDVTTTMQETGETSVFTKTFLVGVEHPDVLVLNHTGSFTVESFNFFVEAQVDSPIRRALADQGLEVALLDPDVHFSGLGPSQLERFPVVIALGGMFNLFGGGSDLFGLQEYVDAGGNLLLSGEQFATDARFSNDRTYRNLANANGLLTTYFPDDNHQQNPQSFDFVGSSYDALDLLTGTWDLGAYDLNHTGESTGIFTDELKLYSANGAETLATYPTGINTGNGFESATVNETLTSRVAAFGFGVEAVNGASELDDVLTAFYSFFAPAPSIGSVSPGKVRNDGRGGFLIAGSGFQSVGRSRVFLVPTTGPAVEMTRVTVLDHETIEVRVPRRFKPGTYDVTVENADGTSDTIADAIKVVKPRT